MIRKLTEKDITLEFIEEYNRIFDDNCEQQNVIDFINDPKYFFFVDYKENEMSGYVYGYFIRGTRKSKWHTHLWSIEVSKKFQRKGLGSILVEKVKEISRKKGSKTIILITQDDEENALEFYRKIGGRQGNNGLDRVVWLEVDNK